MWKFNKNSVDIFRNGLKRLKHTSLLRKEGLLNKFDDVFNGFVKPSSFIQMKLNYKQSYQTKKDIALVNYITSNYNHGHKSRRQYSNYGKGLNIENGKLLRNVKGCLQKNTNPISNISNNETIENTPKITLKMSKRKRKMNKHLFEEEFKVIAYATANEYDLDGIKNKFKEEKNYLHTPIVRSKFISNRNDLNKPMLDPEDVLQFESISCCEEEGRLVHLFLDGVVVFWNVPDGERRDLLRCIRPFEIDKYTKEVVDHEMEDLAYIYAQSSSRIKTSQGLIILNEQSDRTLHKYTVSNALAKSVKLGILETSLDSYVDGVEHATEALRMKGKVVLSHKEVLQRTGELFALNHLLNLSSELLDTPDFFWEYDELSVFYTKITDYLSIEKRTTVMNLKLDHCQEFMELLQSIWNERKSSRLEIIIIILIAGELFHAFVSPFIVPEMVKHYKGETENSVSFH